MQHLRLLEVRNLEWILRDKIQVSAGLTPSGGSGGESVPCLPQLLEATHIPGPLVPSSIVKGIPLVPLPITTPASLCGLLPPS